MKKFISFIAIVWSCSAQSQVLNPNWIAQSILQNQKPFSSFTSMRRSNRSTASLQGDLRKGLVVRESAGWTLVSNHPETVRARVLLLPGFLETDFIYHRVLRDPEPEKKGVELIAGVPPGFGENPAHSRFDFTPTSYAKMISEWASLHKIDLIVGHRLTATVLMEVIRLGTYQGKILLIGPALEPDDEPVTLRALDLASRNHHTRPVAWIGIREWIPELVRPFFPEGEELLLSVASAEALKNPPEVSRKILTGYLDHLRSNPGTLLDPVLMNSGKFHLLVAGKDRVPIKPEHLQTLKQSSIPIHFFPNASHMVMLDSPQSLNTLFLKLTGVP